MFARDFGLSMLLTAGLVLAESAPVPGKPPPTPEEISAAYRARVFKVMDGALYREGLQELPGGIAHLRLPDGYRYLGPEDARKVIVDLWGNPPSAAGSSLLGVIIPDGEHLASPSSWAIVLSYVKQGYVTDSDAGNIDANDLMSRLQAAGIESNKARKASGFDTMDLAGWAAAPRYDTENRALYWAKRFTVEHQIEDTLNYDVRVLGRHGVLSLNAIAGMNRAADIEDASPALIAMVRFNQGHRYDDFSPAADPRSGLTLAGLVLGGIPPAVAPPEDLATPSRFWVHLVSALLILVLLFRTSRTSSLTASAPSPPEPLA